MLRRIVLVVPLVVAVLHAQTQSPPNSSMSANPEGAISGIAIDGSTGAPVTEAIVALQGGKLPPDYQTRRMTDGKGRFAFTHLPDGDNYTIWVSKVGWLDGGYGRDSAPTDLLRPVVIRQGAWIGNLKAAIWRPATISGIVRDETGEPLVGVAVRALARIAIGGRETLASGSTTLTDDRGAYRLKGLFAGRYIVQVPSVQMSVPSATRINAASGDATDGVLDVDDTARLVIGRFPLPPPPVSGRAMAYAPAFHPAASTVADATTVVVGFGDNRTGVDVALAPVPAVRVSGRVDGPAEAFANLTLRLLPAGLEDLGFGAEIATALVSPEGVFTFLNVPAGTYVLDAPSTFKGFTMASGASSFGGTVGFGSGVSLTLPPAGGSSGSSSQIESAPGVSFTTTSFGFGKASTYSGRSTVIVGAASVNGVALRLRPAGTLRGRVVMDVDRSKPAPEKPPTFFVRLDPAGGQTRLGNPVAAKSPVGDSEFEIPGVGLGEYWLRATSAGWIVKSIQWHGRDFSATPIDTASADNLDDVVVTVTNAIPVVSGAVRMPDGSIPESGLVVAFPFDASARTNGGLSPSRMKSSSIQIGGTFSLSTLPAGDYYLAAVDRAHMSKWRDVAVLGALERQAVHVRLVWGQTVTQNLTMRPVQ
jgi:hypothetical protein